MYRTDDPHKDFDRWDADQEKWRESRPKCSRCGEHILDDMAYYINDEWICDECMSEYRKVVP